MSMYREKLNKGYKLGMDINYFFTCTCMYIDDTCLKKPIRTCIRYAE